MSATTTDLEGLLLVCLGGILVGSWPAPLAHINKTKWQWENFWFCYSTIGLLVFPWAFAFLTLSPAVVFKTLASVDSMVYLNGIGLGAIAGLGNSLFSVTVPMIGMALASSLKPAVALVIGTNLPLLLRNPGIYATTSGYSIILAVIILLFALTSGYSAGVARTDFRFKGASKGAVVSPQNEPQKYPLGLTLNVFAGAFGAMLNVGYVLSTPVSDLTLDHGASDITKSYLTWALLMSGYGGTNLVVSLLKLTYSQSWKNFRFILREPTPPKKRSSDATVNPYVEMAGFDGSVAAKGSKMPVSSASAAPLKLPLTVTPTLVQTAGAAASPVRIAQALLVSNKAEPLLDEADEILSDVEAGPARLSSVQGVVRSPFETLSKWTLNFIVAISMGIIHYASFLLYGVGATFLGAQGSSAGFAVFTSSSILTGHIWGFLNGDWKNAGPKALGLMFLTIALLFGGIVVLATGGIR
eukprot:GILK01003869.1.p1 GENE.GILK01003869.1~~GILK01003869.1.p1  ORF type:complete len:469 (-),score=33.79 GILK01003869.1:286-1692(-)